jgi:predicted ATPase
MMKVQELLEAFERISMPVRQGNEFVAPRPELMLVCGYSGIGKTRVIDEVHKPMVQVDAGARPFFY